MSSHHACGAGFAFLGFSLSLLIGLWVDNPFVTVVLRSMFILVVFYVLGCVLFLIGQKAVRENFEAETQKILGAQTAVKSEPEESEETSEAVAAEGRPHPPAEQPAVT